MAKIKPYTILIIHFLIFIILTGVLARINLDPPIHLAVYIWFFLFEVATIALYLFARFLTRWSAASFLYSLSIIFGILACLNINFRLTYQTIDVPELSGHALGIVLSPLTMVFFLFIGLGGYLNTRRLSAIRKK
jgi:hypothetical protein